MEFRVIIKTDGTSFNPAHTEVARMLRDLAKRVEAWGNDHSPMGLADSNGQIVGRTEWNPWDDEDTANAADYGV